MQHPHHKLNLTAQNNQNPLHKLDKIESIEPKKKKKRNQESEKKVRPLFLKGVAEVVWSNSATPF